MLLDEISLFWNVLELLSSRTSSNIHRWKIDLMNVQPVFSDEVFIDFLIFSFYETSLSLQSSKICSLIAHQRCLYQLLIATVSLSTAIILVLFNCS